MNAKNASRHPTKFYQEDIVQRVNDPNAYGVVLRCWHDAEDVPPAESASDPLMRQLEQGEVGISFFPGGTRAILPESEFNLVDRSFQLGDLCKRSIDDVRSGVVVSLSVEGRLEHAISGEPVEGWKTVDDLQQPSDPAIGDFVCYHDWIGQVIEMYDEAVVEIGGKQLVRLPEISSRLSVGERGNDILPSPIAGHSLFGFLTGTNRPHSDETQVVVAVKHTVLAICWLAINQSLSVEEAAARRRPQRFWYGRDLSKLVVIRGWNYQDMRVGDKVYLKDDTNAPFTTHGTSNDGEELIIVKIVVVKETRTTVTVLWQDGSRETIRSTELIPHLNPDEYDCWPGDHVIWKNEGEQRPAVVQRVDAIQRVAAIRWVNWDFTEWVSVLELDPHGTSDLSTSDVEGVFSDGLGVRRGDFVFVHREGTSNGLQSPHVPRIGEIEAWIRDTSILSDGHLSGWRKVMSEIGLGIANQRGVEDVESGETRLVGKGDSSLSWFGEVIELHLDGSVEVAHPNQTRAIYPLERLTKLYDGLQQLEDSVWGETASEGQDSHEDEDDTAEVWWEEDGTWKPKSNADSGDEWEEVDEDDDAMEVDEPGWPDVSTVPIPILPPPRPDTPRPADPMAVSESPPTLPAVVSHSSSSSSSNGVRSPSPDVPKDAVPFDVDEPPREGSSSSAWTRFDILPSAPVDHAFFSSPPARPTKTFMSRLNKEYRALATSLPESIVVRAYEDRSDLLRSLIIGPENTPYEDAPFVIDWMLDSNFPNSPPIAHFMSWTNGNGRVNPNLYEEGKVCLSILGTWAGDRNEIWSAARSSLLQALVSIQGLVLVKEPWFCEPAYEKLRGTEEGIVNSRLYSEKAYVLSRGFVRRALEHPPGSLEGELRWLYFGQGRLHSVVQSARALVEKSRAGVPALGGGRPAGDGEGGAKAGEGEEGEDEGDLAVPRLTAGGIITLQRTLSKLEGILEAGS